MSSSTAPSVWNAVEIASRGENRSSAHSRTTSGSSPSNSTDSSPASRSSSSSTDIRLPPCQLCQLVVRRAVAPRAKGLAGPTSVDPPADEPDHGLVELIGRDTAEERLGDRGRSVEAAEQVDVVRLPTPALFVAHGRALKTDVADPMLRARVRAPVEMQPQPFDRRAEARLEQLHEAVHARLGLGDREVAVRLARAGDRVAAQRAGVERQTDRGEAGRDRLDVLRVGQDKILLPRD